MQTAQSPTLTDEQARQLYFVKHGRIYVSKSEISLLRGSSNLQRRELINMGFIRTEEDRAPDGMGSCGSVIVGYTLRLTAEGEKTLVSFLKNNAAIHKNFRETIGPTRQARLPI